tara:strand:- start:695 stop:943 length:249 start_codon:yes stop_codon:yes gene_type:complete
MKCFEQTDKLKKIISNHIENSKLNNIKTKLTKEEILDIYFRLENIPRFYESGSGRNGSYKAVEKRFLENGREINKVLEILKK